MNKCMGFWRNLGFSDRDITIIWMRFGLGAYQDEHTLEEIGKHFGISRERVRQIEAKALGKIEEFIDFQKGAIK